MNDQKRWAGLDFFKFMAVMSFVFTHSLIWWLTNDDKNLSHLAPELQKNVSIYLQFWSFIPLALPLTAGISLRMMVDDYWNNLRALKTKTYLKRGLKLYILGLIMNYFAWDYLYEIWTWDVLPLMGFSTIVIALLLKYTKMIGFTIFSFFALLITPLLRDILNNQYTIPYNIHGALTGTLDGNHFWPIFPWFFIIYIGFIIGHLFIKYYTSARRIVFYTSLSVLTFNYLKFDHIVLLKLDPANIWGPELMQPNFYPLMNTLAISTIIFSLVSKIKLFQFEQIVYKFSHNIMWIYILHTIIIKKVSNLLYENVKFDLVLFGLYALIQIILIYLCILLKDWIIAKYKSKKNSK